MKALFFVAVFFGGFHQLTCSAGVSSAEVNTSNCERLLQEGYADSPIVDQKQLFKIAEILGIEKPLDVSKEKTFAYVEDTQGYYNITHIFRTNFPGDAQSLVSLSCVPPGAGRISTSFIEFRRLLRSGGYSCVFVRALETNSKDHQHYDAVLGATGSY